MQIKNIVLGIAITFLSFLVIFTGIQTFYSSPDWEDFCGSIYSKTIPKLVDENTVCTQEAKQCPDGTYVSRDPKNNCEFLSCDFQIIQQREYDKCQKDYETSNEKYSKNLFIITLILGIFLLLLGGKLFNLEAVGAGIMGGGVITLIYGAGSYWQYAGDWFRFAVSIVGLILVIYLAYWLNSHRKKLTKKRR